MHPIELSQVDKNKNWQPMRVDKEMGEWTSSGIFPYSTVFDYFVVLLLESISFPICEKYDLKDVPNPYRFAAKLGLQEIKKKTWL